MNPPRTYLPNLTALRFLLALLVVLYHTAEFSENRGFPFFNDWALFRKGAEGVYMFFSLSGFLIIKQLYDEKRLTKTINLKGFYVRRILRIFPLYYLVLAFGFLYYHVILEAFGFEFENNYNLLKGLLLSMSFFSNIFSTYAPGGILEILWSIGIEEQFYLVIAPVLLLIPKQRIVLFLSAFTMLYFLIFFSEHFEILRDFQMFFFYFSFAGVSAILLEYDAYKKVLEKLRYPLLFLVVLYYASSVFTDLLNPFSYHLTSMILFGLFLSALSIKPLKILENKTMKALGKISYGIYMYHAIMIQVVGFLYLKVVSKLNWTDNASIILINCLVISMTIIASQLSYRYYESYFLKMKTKSWMRSKTEVKAS
jgi:peptidoglycan/LPS O-acetylase OafA/YrhL